MTIAQIIMSWPTFKVGQKVRRTNKNWDIGVVTKVLGNGGYIVSFKECLYCGVQGCNLERVE